MKIIWLTNVLTPAVVDNLGCYTNNFGGWISGAYYEIIHRKDINIFSCCAYKEKIIGPDFCTFQLENDNEKYFIEILKREKPDIIHIFGTEFRDTYEMVIAAEKCGLLDKVVVSIQGLVSVCCDHYFANLPNKIVNRYTFRDLIRNDNIKKQSMKFRQRGILEKKALKKVKHVIGRTDWDKACVQRINPDIHYHFCNEILRPAFYKNAGKWSIENCEKHSIFVSQCSYPLKGFHLVLEAVNDIIKKYPDAHLYTTGNNPLKFSFLEKLRRGSYQKYIGELIKKYHLEDKVTFLGSLSEDQMCQQYLKSNVFLSASSLENSPNSVGEAMILGVPVVSSHVGGVASMLINGKEGYLYPYDEPYMAAFYIDKVFSDESLHSIMSQAAYEHATHTHCQEINGESLYNIYKYIST